MAISEITGMDTVMRNLNAAIEKIEGRTLAGVIQGALLVQRRAVQRTPVDSGNLRASAHTVIAGSVMQGEKPDFKGKRAAQLAMNHAAQVAEKKAALAAEVNPMAEVGFSANYGLYVHENLSANFKEGGAKFLQSAVAESRADIVRIIQEKAKVDG